MGVMEIDTFKVYLIGTVIWCSESWNGTFKGSHGQSWLWVQFIVLCLALGLGWIALGLLGRIGSRPEPK